MGTIVRFPARRHARASSASTIKKSSIRTSPPVASLNRLASFMETPRSPLRISDKCGSEHAASAANLAWVISLWLSIQTASGCLVLMPKTLLLAKSICQALLCWREMDMHRVESTPLLMAKVVHLPTDGTRLFIGEWCRVLDITPARISREAPINFGYLSGLISGKKTNPSRDKLEAIARVLKIKVGQLYSAPPPAKLLEQIAEHDPEVIYDLLKKRKKRS